MPGNLPVPGGVEIRLFWGSPTTNDAVTVLHCRTANPGLVDQAFANLVDTTVKGQFTTSGLAAHIVPQVHLHTVGVRNMADSTAIEYLGGTTPTAPGTDPVTTPLPANVSVCVSGSTGLRGASFRSRTYLWGFGTDAVAPAGGVSDAVNTAAPAFMNGLRTALAGLPNALTLCVLSRFTTPPGATAPLERNPPILTTINSYALKDRVFDSQRRRAVPGI
jgi:hypothetical protein